LEAGVIDLIGAQQEPNYCIYLE